MNTKNQKIMASKILKSGVDKVWVDPEQSEEVSKAITKADVRRLIKKGYIKKKKVNGQSRGRARKIMIQKKKGKRRGIGSRKGKKLSKTTKKKEWIKIVRPLRKMLKELRESGSLTPGEYRKLYLMVKGGRFRNKSHLNLYIKEKFKEVR